MPTNAFDSTWKYCAHHHSNNDFTYLALMHITVVSEAICYFCCTRWSICSLLVITNKMRIISVPACIPVSTLSFERCANLLQTLRKCVILANLFLMISSYDQRRNTYWHFFSWINPIAKLDIDSQDEMSTTCSVVGESHAVWSSPNSSNQKKDNWKLF